MKRSMVKGRLRVSQKSKNEILALYVSGANMYDIVDIYLFNKYIFMYRNKINPSREALEFEMIVNPAAPVRNVKGEDKVKEQVKTFVEFAEKLCDACVNVRQEKVKLVRVSSWLTCPFKEAVATRVSPPPACYAITGPAACSRNDDNTFCPLLHVPLYRNGEVIMLQGVTYKPERR